ncbi:MAG: DUF1264 domain-containing protein [Terriglobales bacterium]
MVTKLAVLGLVLLCTVFALVWAMWHSAPTAVASDQPAATKASPADGYTVHVLAPHLVDGKQMGPYHHYCKVLAPDPVIQCLIYESTEPNARLSQVEFIVAKKLTRNQVSLRDWNKNWHDHTIEIASGRVQVLDLPPDKAKEVADLVSTTDGLIVHFYYDGDLPNGQTSVAQAVGHEPMKEAEFKNPTPK